MSPQSVTRTISPAIGGAAGEAAGLADLLPHLRGVAVERIECTPARVVIGACWWPERAACPACGTWSSRAHSGYVRRLHDSPVGGRPVVICLKVRRFLCKNPACKAVTFAGQADGLTLRYQRWSVPHRKTARRFAQAVTSDDAVARAISRPTVLDRYQPHLNRRWNEGCRDTAVLHAEITQLGYRGSLRTLYRYLQPLRASAAPAPATMPPPKIGEVTSWLLRRAEDLDPHQQQMLTDLRAPTAHNWTASPIT